MAVIGFMLGGTTVVLAATSGAVKIEAFNLADGTDPTHLAKVDVSGNVAVSIANTPSVSLSGTPSVSVSGTPTVRVARQPFQQFVNVSFTSGGEACEALTVPAGMRLTIEAATADASASAQPNLYLRTDASLGGGTSFVRSVDLEVRALASAGWTGQTQTLLFAGTGLEPESARTYTVHACGYATSPGYFRMFVTGHLDPL
jgi:hypothetical protein